MNERKFAIYSRKSKYTGKGESTTNQIKICEETILSKFGKIKKEDIQIYEDEGFSGYNINRPAFNKLLKDIENNKIKVLIFYKLDRISRNVKDFSKLMSIFEEHQVTFLSATENIETVTPSGKALTYMISVFAELERNTIAERIKDNMLELAKSGVWLGGITPTGYSSTSLTITCNNKKKKIFNLKQNQEITKVSIIFQKFLELKSLTKLETYLLNNNIKSTNLKPYTRFSIKNILTNPVYVAADKNIYDYYKSKNANIYKDKKEFNGNFGLMVYNKTKNINHKYLKKKDITSWIISIGKHKPIIDGKIFITTLNILSMNDNKRYRKMNNTPSISSGLIKCSNCNTNMRPKIRSHKENGIIFDYICELKEKSKKKLCQAKNINGCLLDDIILKDILSLDINTNKFLKSLKNTFKTRKNNELKELIAKKNKNNTIINNLIDKIKYLDIEIIKSINDEIKELKKENETIERKIYQLSSVKKVNISAKELLSIYKRYINKLDTKTKKYYADLLIDSVKANNEMIIINYK